MATVYRIGSNQYAIGANKKTGKIVLFELCVNGPLKAWKPRAEADSIPEIAKEIKRLQRNAERREFRKTIAGMCNTSYAAACQDMGRIAN